MLHSPVIQPRWGALNALPVFHYICRGLGVGRSSTFASGLSRAGTLGRPSTRHLLAKGISFLINPPVVAAVVFVAVTVGLEGRAERYGLLVAICLFFGVVLPTGYVWMLKIRGQIEDLFIPVTRDRRGPLLFGSLSFLLGTAALTWASASPVLLALMFCYAANGLLLAGISFRWKISLHAVGAWGPLAALCFLVGPQALFLIPVPIVVSWARVELGSHTFSQVSAGGALSVCLTWLIFSLVVGVPPSG